MLRRSFLGIVGLAVLWTVTLTAQVKELPKTATGEIQKYVLRAQRTAIAPQ